MLIDKVVPKVDDYDHIKKLSIAGDVFCLQEFSWLLKMYQVLCPMLMFYNLHRSQKALQWHDLIRKSTVLVVD